MVPFSSSISSLYHIVVILAIFQAFSLLLYFLWWSAVSDLCCYYCDTLKAASQFSHSVMSDSLQPLWTAACQACLPITNSRSLSKLMSIESVIPSNHLILCCPVLLLPSAFPSIPEFFPRSQFFTSDGQTIGVSALASVLPVNIQD